MKICPKCKNEYADNVATCPEDGTILDLEIPEEASELETAASRADAVPHTTDAVDRIGTAAAETFDRDAEILGTGAGITADRISTAAFSQTDDSVGDYTENPLFGWLVPLIIVALLVIMGFMFCSKSPASRAAINGIYVNNNQPMVL